jgi:hypothetical protein
MPHHCCPILLLATFHIWLFGKLGSGLKLVKGIVQRILRGSCLAHSIRASKMEAHTFFFLNFKGTPSQEEQKTVFSGLKFIEMVSSDLSDLWHFSVCVR